MIVIWEVKTIRLEIIKAMKRQKISQLTEAVKILLDLELCYGEAKSLMIEIKF